MGSCSNHKLGAREKDLEAGDETSSESIRVGFLVCLWQSHSRLAITLTLQHHHPDSVHSDRLIPSTPLRRTHQDVVHFDGGAAGAAHLHETDSDHNHIRIRLARICYQVKHCFLSFSFETFTTLLQVRGTFEEVSRTCVENPAKGSFGLANIILCKSESAIKIRCPRALF